jgi:signal transduction histidine kinase
MLKRAVCRRRLLAAESLRSIPLDLPILEPLSAVSRMVAHVSHDLRLPLTAILANAEFLTQPNATGQAATAFPNQHNRVLALGGGSAFAAFLFFGLPLRRRRTQALLSLLLLGAFATIVMGCGGAQTAANPVRHQPIPSRRLPIPARLLEAT